MGWEKEKRGRGAGLEEASKQRREKTDGQEAKKIPSSLRTDGKREKGGGGGWENYRRAKRENEERKTEGTGLQSITGARKEFFFLPSSFALRAAYSVHNICSKIDCTRREKSFPDRWPE